MNNYPKPPVVRRADIARRHRRVAPLTVVAFICLLALAACGSTKTSTGTSTGTEAVTPTSAPSTDSRAAESSATSTGSDVAVATEATAAEQATEGTESDGTATTKATAVATDPDAVAVTFDAPKGDPRPIHETMQPIAAPTKRLSMEISGLTYRGVVCGFTFHGDAPPSPVTIRLSGQSGAGPFDSGALKVAWTELNSHAVTSAAGQDGRWNFSSEAHADRAGNGWVVSLGGVTPADGDEAAATPKRAACVLEADTPVFTPANGPVGYWASFAGV